MDLDKLKAEAHNDLLTARAFDRAVSSLHFADAFMSSTDDDKILLSVILKSKDIDQLRLWVRSRLYTVLEDMPYGKLRELAAEEHVPRYSRMTKDELIRALEAKQSATSLGKRREPVERCEGLADRSRNPDSTGGDAEW